MQKGIGSAMLLHKEDYEGIVRRDEVPGQIPSAARELYEMVCLLEGNVEYWIEDQHYRLGRGDVLLIPAGVMVSANLKPRGCVLVRYSVWMSQRFLAFLKLQDSEADYAFQQALTQGKYMMRPSREAAAALRARFEAVEAENGSSRMNAELCGKATLSLLVGELNRTVKEGGEGLLQKGQENRLSPVLRYIHEKCTEPMTVERLASAFSFSPSHLAHNFKKQLGISIYQYILLRRLQIGRAAMLEGVPVREAYQKCGFGDYAGFYRAFLKEYGMSPQQYKKKYQ